MNRLLYIFAAALLLLLQSCTSSDIKHRLDLAESMMSERPDSSLVLLETIDMSSISSHRYKAKYALLYSQAKDKNYIDETDDSLINVALDYYKDHGDMHSRMLSYYYLARVRYNAEEYASSITSLLNAEDIAIDLEDDFYLGLIYRQFSDIYANIFNSTEELNYAQKSYSHFKKSGEENYIDWALWDIARSYHNCKDYDSSIRTALELIELGRLRNNQGLSNDGMRMAGLSYMANDQYQESIDIYNQLLAEAPEAMTVKDYRNLGLAYLGNGDITQAQYYMDIVLQADSTQQWLPYEISKRLGDYKSAFEALEVEHHYQDQIVNTIITQNVTEAVTNYRYYERMVNDKDIRYQRITKVVAISVLVTIIILVSIIAYQRIKSQKHEIEKNILLASNLRNILQIKEAEAFSLQSSFDKQIEYKIAETEKLNKAINSLLEQRFATIDKLSSVYYEYQGTANEKQKIYAEVMRLVKGVGSDKTIIKELENFINEYKSNLLIRFKNEFTDIKDSDYILYLYVVAGFSARAISIFIGENIDVVYNRKSRLKQRINKNDSVYKDEFLECLR